MTKLRFKYNALMDRYSATSKATGDKYVIVPKINGQIYTYLNEDLIDDRARTVKEAKRNANEYLVMESAA
jgi:hypothetical protein